MLKQITIDFTSVPDYVAERASEYGPFVKNLEHGEHSACVYATGKMRLQGLLFDEELCGQLNWTSVSSLNMWKVLLQLTCASVHSPKVDIGLKHLTVSVCSVTNCSI